MKRLTTIWKSGIAGKLLVGCGGLIGLAIVCGICGTPFAQKPAPTPHPTATPYPAPTIPAQPTPTPIPPSPTPIPPTPTAIPTSTPTPGIDIEDAAYLLLWQDAVEPWLTLAGGLLDDISEAAARVDVIEICEPVDSFYDACVHALVELDDLPSPSHSYLLNAHQHNQVAIEKWALAGLALQEFCDTLDVDELEAATLLLDEATEQFNTATEWVNKYGEEIQ